MSTTHRRVPLAVAKQITDELVELLQPACQSIIVAGSIRRQRDDVGDIDLVCIPRFRVDAWAPTDGAVDLFGQPVTPPSEASVSLLDQRCAELLEQGVLEHRLDINGRKSWGAELKKGRYQELNLDICSATIETHAVTLAIRTGPAEFSKRLVTVRRQGGLCPHHLHFRGWRLRRRDNGDPLETPDEETLFRELGIAYLPPIFRTDTVVPRRLANVSPS